MILFRLDAMIFRRSFRFVVEEKQRLYLMLNVMCAFTEILYVSYAIISRERRCSRNYVNKFEMSFVKILENLNDKKYKIHAFCYISNDILAIKLYP